MPRERMNARKRNIIIGLVILIVLAVALSLIWTFSRRHQPIRIQTIDVQLKQMKQTTLSSGNVRPTDRQLIYANQLPSAVKKLDVQAGDNVKAGQTLLELDDTSQQSAVTAAQAALAVAEEAYNRALQGFDTAASVLQSVWLPQIASTQNSVNVAKEQLAGAEAELAATHVLANISGKVLIATKNGISPGGSQSPVIELVGSGEQIVLSVSEVDAVHVAKGMTVSITSDAFPNETYKGVVMSVAPFAVTSQSGSGDVQVLVKPSGKFPVPLGYQVNCKITSQTTEKVPVIPYGALVQQGTSYIVYVVKDGHVQPVPVKLGITNDSGVQVASGVKAGETVVLNPPENLVAGEAVRTS